MSFSTQVKTEICRQSPHKLCCVRAACYGFACFGKYFDEKGLVLHTERAMIAQQAQHLFRQLGIKSEIVEKQRQDGGIYEFAVKDPMYIWKMQAEFGHIGLSDGIDRKVFRCPACRAAFLGAAFLSAGVVMDPAKEYSLEFVLFKEQLADQLAQVLTEAGYEPKRARRQYSYVLYYRASEQVTDLLTMIGATNASLELMNQKIYKELRNQTNRITNCENANIDKILDASQTAIQNLQLLRQNQKFETLPEQLRQIAILRIDHPECALAELGQMLEPPLGKSGVSHRLRKLAALAQDVEKQARGRADDPTPETGGGDVVKV